MDTIQHDQLMQKIMKEMEDNNLNLADGITLWHSLGMFLFSNIDKDNKEIEKIYAQMQEYLEDMKSAQGLQK